MRLFHRWIELIREPNFLGVAYNTSYKNIDGIHDNHEYQFVLSNNRKLV